MAESTRKRILIVDDELMVLQTIKRYLQDAGFEVETVTNGTDAVERVRQSFPDLIIMDAIMPGMNGYQATREIRNLDKEKKIPIIMLTGLKADSDVMYAREAGVTEFVTKPANQNDLIRRIKAQLKISIEN